MMMFSYLSRLCVLENCDAGPYLMMGKALMGS